MKISRLLLLFIITPLFSLAQGLKPGFVILTKGDTLLGYVGVSGNSKLVHFKKTATEPTQNFKSADVLSAMSGKDEYIRFMGKISMNTISEDHMQSFRDTSTRFDAVLLHVVEKGRYLTMLRYSDDMRERFYICDNAAKTTEELTYRLYYSRDTVSFVEHRGRTVNENTYMAQIIELATKYKGVYDGMIRDLELSTYRQQYLREIIRKINAQAEKNNKDM